MTQTKNITETTTGKHLSSDERKFIQRWNHEGLSNREIVRRLYRAPQTIHNKIKKETVKQISQQKQDGIQRKKESTKTEPF